MTWRCPLVGVERVVVPVPPHRLAFGIWHERRPRTSVGLCAPMGTRIAAAEAGKVIGVIEYTTNPRSLAVVVEGPSGRIVYGGISAAMQMAAGYDVARGQLLGYVVPIIHKVVEGPPPKYPDSAQKAAPRRPKREEERSMLCLELWMSGSERRAWPKDEVRPANLLDPTDLIRQAELAKRMRLSGTVWSAEE